MLCIISQAKDLLQKVTEMGDLRLSYIEFNLLLRI